MSEETNKDEVSKAASILGKLGIKKLQEQTPKEVWREWRSRGGAASKGVPKTKKIKEDQNAQKTKPESD